MKEGPVGSVKSADVELISGTVSVGGKSEKETATEESVDGGLISVTVSVGRGSVKEMRKEESVAEMLSCDEVGSLVGICSLKVDGGTSVDCAGSEMVSPGPVMLDGSTAVSVSD